MTSCCALTAGAGEFDPDSEVRERPRRSTNHCCVLVSGRIEDRVAEEEVTVAAADAARELIPEAVLV